nr:NlpC/P60 family protein [Aneurinibacillus tyrosinisolvens]
MKKKKILTVLIAGSIALTGIFTPIGQKSVSASSEELISTAKSLIGVPYKWGGTTKNGFDCSGFLNYLFKSEHVSLPRTANDMYHRGTTISRSGFVQVTWCSSGLLAVLRLHTPVCISEMANLFIPQAVMGLR